MRRILRERAAGRSHAGSARYRQSEGLLQAEQGGQVVVLDARGSRYYGLDPVGARIWELLAQGPTAEEIAQRLQCEFDAPGEQIQRDVRQFLAELEAAHLVAVESQP